ncbi:YfiR family protein [Neptunicella sp. SCSIO 80796]|uniref:YfiR family protein n=1 Tax=Neptunicella plasticusilytica TaxID=3117012 RepID=UPI003A4E2967
MRVFVKATLLPLCLVPSFELLAVNAQPAQVRAPLLYHMVEFTQYPSDRLQNNSINMCFLESPKFEHANKLMQSNKKRVKELSLAIIKLQNIEELQQTDCHLLFVSKQHESKELTQILDELNQDTLTAGETAEFVEDGGLLSIVPGKSNMDILVNMQQLKKSPLKISSAVLKLAKLY